MLKDNYDLAQLLSAESASKDLQDLYAPSNQQSPDRLYGSDTAVAVLIKNVSFLNNHTATVRFQTEERTQSRSTGRHRVAHVKFLYVDAPMKNESRFDNPLGF